MPTDPMWCFENYGEAAEYIDQLEKQRDELLAALKYARELVDDWGAYASNYMQEKHDLAGDLDRLDAHIKGGGTIMTTTAFDDQFTAEPEPVRQPYDTGSILRRNVADLELALKQQTERAEAAEEKLTTARDDMQSWIDSRNGWMERAGAAEAEMAKLRELPNVPIDAEAFEIHRMNRLIAADPKMNAPSSLTDEQIHAAYRNALGQSIRERDMPEIRKFARALLQSAGATK